MSVKFISDNVVDSLACTEKDVVRLFSCLCGEEIAATDRDERLLKRLLNKTTSFNYQQINEVLLLLNQDRVSEGFFEFFFNADINKVIAFEELKEGIKNFRGFAMLKYGNFRFAYKNWKGFGNRRDLDDLLVPFTKDSAKLESLFKKRPHSILEIEKIQKDKTWLLGYISRNKVEKDIKRAKKEGNEKRKQELERVGEERDKFVNIAQNNTDIYLTWDYMDVYIATSMREKWEFEDCFDFVDNLFKSNELKNLKLRYFDPTQSLTANRIDKGLIEGLMIKRAACTMYLAQETETLGKDSELAATLAQGKPVIAFIPKVAKKHFKSYPLLFFWKRFMLLKIGGYLEDPDLQRLLAKKLECSSGKVNSELTEVVGFLEGYVAMQTYHLYEDEKQREFLQDKKETHSKMYNIYEVCENYYMDKKEKDLREIHPLGIQMAFESGVANGVLVVRTIGDCAKLFYDILTNSTQFDIEHKEKVTMLVERTSKCPFRVVTDSAKLENSFWNFYLQKWL
jgi:hypothetical protein